MCDGSHAKLDQIKLYVFSESVNCSAVSCFVNDANIPCEIVTLQPGDNLKGDFLAKFPMGCLPALSDGEFNTFESCSIMRYLCNKFMLGSPFYPSDPLLRAKVDRMLDWRQTVFYGALSGFCYPVFGLKPNDPVAIANSKAEFTKLCEIFTSKFLEGKPLIGGQKPCIADYSLVLPLVMIGATDYVLSADMQAYYDRFITASPNYDVTVAPLLARIETLKTK
jgi:glutathione S-transferase